MERPSSDSGKKCNKLHRPKYEPTDEQRSAIDAFRTGKSLKISAFAGAGKTSTLQFLAAERLERGLYLAFNKSIATDAAEKFPRHVDCRTTHSQALRHVRQHYNFTNDRLFATVNTNLLAQALNLRPMEVARSTTLTPPQVAAIYLACIRRYCQSAKPELSPEHVHLPVRLRALRGASLEALHEQVLKAARSLWDRMVSPAGDLPLGHDGYLKLWSNDSPRLDFAYVLLDEAQDTNPAVLRVLLQQPHSQLVFVGDSHQQIYEWRGAVDAMASIETAHHIYLTQSFRFGYAIADLASKLLRRLGEERRVRGLNSIQSRISSAGDPDAVLARTNATVIGEVLDSVNRGQRPHIVGGTSELERLVRDVYSLKSGKPGSQPEFFGFRSWAEVVTFASSEEGLPLQPIVNLVEKNGPDRLWAAIKASTDAEEEASLIVSTAHRSKGREWPSVRIADDFSESETDEGKISPDELRLFYVAATRARTNLIVDAKLVASFCGGHRGYTQSSARAPAATLPPPTARRPESESGRESDYRRETTIMADSVAENAAPHGYSARRDHPASQHPACSNAPISGSPQATQGGEGKLSATRRFIQWLKG